MGFKTLIVETDGAVCFVRINRPEMNNKLSIECMEEFTELLRSKTDDNSCHSVVLAGGDKFFCAGGELGDFRKKTSVEIKKFGNAFITMHLAMQYFPKPIVAAVEADAFGGGFSVVEACDFAVGAKDALFAVPEMAAGLAPAMGFSGIYANVPKKTAMALGLMSKKLTAEQALEYGLLNEVMPKNKVVGRAMELAHYFDDKNPTSVRLFKEMYRDMGFLAYERRLRIGEGCMLATFKSADGQEVLTAEEEGRSPLWVNN